ncbi:MAG: 3-deoxy-D-manno-octulosonic acid transferase [Acidobacteria bacterium]|nr:3-deoxy-D-manno-octulosonic acid transferase [Acidobacteriota bacterium]
MYFFYSLAIIGYAAAVAPRLLYQAARHGKYVGTVRERWGRLPATLNPSGACSIWIHAVSVGEVLATRALIPALRARYPDHRLLLSTTTQTGRSVAESLNALDGVFYFPVDLASVVRRVLAQVRPTLLVMVDTELWPNVLAQCARHGVSTLLVNGRISDRSFPRYRFIRPFFRHVLGNVSLCCAQTEESARRLIALGAPPERVIVTGNLKFDTLPVPEPRSAWIPQGVLRAFRMSAGRTVVMAASTHAGEESFVLDAFVRIRERDSHALLILAPRHPERFSQVVALAVGRGLETTRRSALPVDREPRAAVVVLDTVGELATLLQIATVVFLGGSLVPTGGHNLLEPAAWGKPVVFGPHMQNFAELAELFVSNRAARQIGSAEALEPVLAELLGDPGQRAALGAAARALVEANRGATDRTLDAIAALLSPTATTVAGSVTTSGTG